jgi:hypothetical protein
MLPSLVFNVHAIQRDIVLLELHKNAGMNNLILIK